MKNKSKYIKNVGSRIGSSWKNVNIALKHYLNK